MIESASIQAPARGSGFTGDVMKLTVGTTVAQAVSLLAAPVLSRLFAPDAFGVLGLFTALTGALAVVACLRYEFSIMLPETAEEAANQVAVCVVAVLGVTTLVALAVLLGHDAIPRWLHAPHLAPYLWLAPVVVGATGLYNALNQWNTRTRQFLRLAVAQMAGSGANTLVALAAGFAGFVAASSLIAAVLVSVLLCLLLLGGQIWRDDGAVFRRGLTWARLRDGALRYRKFPLFGSGGALLNALTWQLPPILLAIFFSERVVGSYAYGAKVMNMPMVLVGTAIANVFFQRAARARDDGTLPELAEATLARLAKLATLPMLLLLLLGRDIFAVVFGAPWAEAGVYMQILSLLGLVWFLAAPLLTLADVLEKQELSLKVQAGNFVLRCLALVAGGLLHDARLALLLYAAIGLAMYGGLALTLLRLAGVSPRRAGALLGRRLLPVLPFLAGVGIMQYLHVSSLWLTLTAGVLLAGHLGYLAMTDPELRARLKTGDVRY
jgi:O-antigen/teichoic acid export membrane protein